MNLYKTLAQQFLALSATATQPIDDIQLQSWIDKIGRSNIKDVHSHHKENYMHIFWVDSSVTKLEFEKNAVVIHEGIHIPARNQQH